MTKKDPARFGSSLSLSSLDTSHILYLLHVRNPGLLLPQTGQGVTHFLAFTCAPSPAQSPFLATSAEFLFTLQGPTDMSPPL